MTPSNRDYPRMLYHFGDRDAWRIVQNEDEEAALGAEWSRKLRISSPGDEVQAIEATGTIPQPEPEPVETTAKPRRGRPPKA